MGLMDFATQVNKLENYPVILVYGKEGAGKTHFAGGFPRPLIVDFDGGEGTYKNVCPDAEIISIDRGHIAAGKIDVYEDLSRLFADAAKRKGMFAPGGRYAECKTLVIDGWTSLANSLIYQIVSDPGEDVDNVEKMQLQQWGQLAMMQESLMGKLKSIPMVVVITCWLEFRQIRADVMLNSDVKTQAKDKQGNDDFFVPIPNVPGSYRDKIRFEVSEVYYLARDRTNTRQLYCVPFKKYLAKSKVEGSMPSPLANPSAKTLFPYLSKVYKLGVEKKPDSVAAVVPNL